MKTIAALTLASFALLCVPPANADIIETFGTGTNAFTMTFVPIGNPGNAPDATGDPNPAGSVGYHYRMGKYEVSRDMIIKANLLGELGITLQDMTTFGGNGANRPATGVTWNEAARFVNWLNTSQNYSPAYKFAQQPGQPGYSALANITLWQASDSGFDAVNRFRNSLARYFLPSMDEWYKAAFYDPNANGGAGGYWDFSTGSDSAPIAVSEGTLASSSVYRQPFNQGPANTTNAGGLSHYQVMGMGGNVHEWQETENDLANNSPSSARSVRGGGWNQFSSIELSASGRVIFGINPTAEGHGIGFRVASIPEPSSAALLMLATLGLWQRRKRMS